MYARYTIDELMALRESRLVRKPDDLPSIESWLDQPATPAEREQSQPNQHQNQRKNGRNSQNGQASREEHNAPMGNFAATTSRPSLLGTRHTSRSSMNTGGTSLTRADLPRVAANLVRTLQADGLLEDIVLAPPKTSFASSRNISRLNSESGDKLTATTENANEDESASTHPPRTSRFFGDKTAHKASIPLLAKHDNNRWRPSHSKTDDEDRNTTDGDRFSGRRDRNADSQEDRRNGGFGQRSDQRWTRDGDSRPTKIAEAQRGGWRDREKARQENNHYGGREQHGERDPEWMDEPAANDDSLQMKTVDDFEKWKESMKKKSQPATADAEDSATPTVPDTPVKSAIASATPATPVLQQQDAAFGALFGTWGESRPVESPAEVVPKQQKPPATNKAKSRFTEIFASKDEPRQLAEPALPSIFQHAAANGSSEDQAGFARIMAMLGGKPPIQSPALDQSPAISSPAQASGLGALVGAPPSLPPPEQQQQQQPRQPTYAPDAVASFVEKKSSSSRPQSGISALPYMSPHPPQDKTGPFSGPRGSNPASNVASPDPSRVVRSESALPNQPQFPFLDQSSQQRHTQQTPESVNVQQIVAGGRAEKPRGALNKDSEFLLNLISQAKSNNRSAVSQNAQMSQHAQQQSYGANQQNRSGDDFQLFLDQPPPPSQSAQRKSTQPVLEPHAPKPQQPHRVPGALEEQLFKGGIPQMNMGPPQNDRNMDQPQPRGQQQRVPPGFFEDPAIMQHQHQHQQQQQMQQGRRQTQAPQSQQGLPEHLSFPGPLPPGFNMGPGPQQQQAGANEQRGMPQPPPGFNPNLRHPPGFAGIPGIFQPAQSAGLSQQREERTHQQRMQSASDFAMMQGPGPLAQMHGHVPATPSQLQAMSTQALAGMGPPPPGFGMGAPPPNMMPPPPPGFFNGMPPPPGFMPGPPGMMGPPNPPGLQMGGAMGAGPQGIRSPIDGPGQYVQQQAMLGQLGQQQGGMPLGYGSQQLLTQEQFNQHVNQRNKQQREQLREQQRL